MTLPMYGTVFAFFALIKSIMINCVMTNKMARNEHMNRVRHIHIIQGTFLLRFLVLNGY